MTRNSNSLQYNIDASQRELDRRNAEGEDVSRLFVDPVSAQITRLRDDCTAPNDYASYDRECGSFF